MKKVVTLDTKKWALSWLIWHYAICRTQQESSHTQNCTILPLSPFINFAKVKSTHKVGKKRQPQCMKYSMKACTIWQQNHKNFAESQKKGLHFWNWVKKSLGEIMNSILESLTHMRSWAMAKLPREDAKCKGLLESLGLTGALTSSWTAWANTSATDFISDLEKLRHKFSTHLLKIATNFREQ